MDQIETMRAFVAVAQEESFTRAARRLGKSTKLVSNRIAALEARLATQLFNRTTRSVRLTDMGAAYLERCRPLLDEFDELQDLVQSRQRALSGLIRITAPTGFGSTHLVRALAPFLSDHAAVEVDLHLSDARVALVEEGFDLGVRIGILRDSTLQVRKLADMPLVVCASPDYLAAHGRPGHPRALASHTCIIHADVPDAVAWPFRSRDGVDTVRVSGRIRGNAPRAAVELAKAGLGIARSPLYAAEAALADGSLVELFGDRRTDPYGLYALYPPKSSPDGPHARLDRPPGEPSVDFGAVTSHLGCSVQLKRPCVHRLHGPGAAGNGHRPPLGTLTPSRHASTQPSQPTLFNRATRQE